MVISENINIVENIVDKKDKKKNKKGKKENKGITQELFNATNIATSMILQDPNKATKHVSKFGANGIVDSHETKDSNTSDQRSKTPIITEVIPKKIECASETRGSSPSTSNANNNLVNFENSSDYLTSFGKSIDILNPLETNYEKINLRETKIIEPDEIFNKNSVDDSMKYIVDISLESSKNIIKDSENPHQPFTINEKVINPNEWSSNTEDDINDLQLIMNPKNDSHSLDDENGNPERKVFISNENFSTMVPDKISGAVKVVSEISSSELPEQIPGKVISEKVISTIPDIIHGSSKVTVEKITTEIPNETAGIPEIITEKITTDILDNIEGVSKFVTEKASTEMSNFGGSLQSNSPAPAGIISNNDFKSAAEEEELTNLEETKEISNYRFNDIIKNLSSSSREDIEQLLAGTLSQDPGTQDEKLTNLLIDMLIEQETMKLAASGDLPEALDSDGSDFEETNSTNQTSTLSENSVIDINTKSKQKSHTLDSVNTDFKSTNNENVQPQNNSIDTLRTMVKENSEPAFLTCMDMTEITSGTEGNSSPKPYVTTPTLSRRGIGGSQRYSREERPMLVEINKRYEGSSDEEDDNDATENSQYVVTEPSPTVTKRKVTFKFDSQDITTDDEDEDERVHFELVGEPKKEKKKEVLINISRSSSTDSTSSKRNSIEIPKFDDLKTAEKVERKFERMASETLEDNSLAKGAVEGEFQRLTSQLSHEEMDECLMIWNESELDPIGETMSEDVELDDDLEEDGGMVFFLQNITT